MDRGKLFLIPNLIAPGTAKAALPCNIKETVDTIDFYFAEEIRTARRFLSEVNIGKKIEDLKFYKVDKDTSVNEIQVYFSEIPAGENVGIISEAGCPCIADPGSLAVLEAHRLGMKVVPMVGPSSILLALIGSGLNGQSFVFHGYLPIEKDLRAKAIKTIEKESVLRKQTQIFIETPYRNNKLLEELIKNCRGESKLCVAVNLTSENQYIATKTIKEWKDRSPDLNKQPAIFLLFG